MLLRPKSVVLRAVGRRQFRLLMVRLFLIGYSGAGKTTLGRAFARSVGFDFIDLDWYIEQRFHSDIATLFRQRGEDGFRRLERNLLHEVGEFENVIISCGGGTPCYSDNMDYMLSAGITVFLQSGEEALFRRLKVARDARPLLQGKDDEALRAAIRQACEERRQFYERAAYTITSDRLENREEIAGTVEQLRRMLDWDKLVERKDIH